MHCVLPAPYPPDDELSLMRKQREKHPNSHSQEVEVSALADGMLSKPVGELLRSFIRAGVKPARGMPDAIMSAVGRSWGIGNGSCVTPQASGSLAGEG